MNETHITSNEGPTHPPSIQDLELRVAELTKQLAEAKKDSERLDWLEIQASVPAVTLVKADGLRERNRFTVVTETGRVGDFATVRHAIDAAMQPLPPAPSHE